MIRTRRSLKVIIGLTIAIPVTCFLFQGNLWAKSFSKDKPEGYYQKAATLIIEASKDLEHRQWKNSMGKYKEALKKIQTIQEKFPDWNTPAMLEESAKCQHKISLLEITILADQALKLEKERKNDEGIKLCNELLAKYGEKYKDTPALCATRVRLGTMYRYKGMYDAAIDTYNGVLAKYPEERYKRFRTNSKLGIGFIYQSQGKYAEAEKIFQEIIAEDSSATANFLKIFLQVLPVKSWGEIGGVLSIIEEFLNTDMSKEKFIASVIKVNKKLEKDALVFIGVKLQIGGKIDEAKKYYQGYLDGSLNEEGFGYKIATIALQGIEKTIAQ